VVGAFLLLLLLPACLPAFSSTVQYRAAFHGRLN